MNANYLIKKLVILGIIFLVTLGLIFPSTSADPIIDSDDGVWIDNFDNETYLTLKNCELINESIQLKKTQNFVEFDFTDKKWHKAYSYELADLKIYSLQICTLYLNMNSENILMKLIK